MSTNTTDDALARAITDAEQIMKAMSLTTDPAEKKQLSEALKQQIEQAEASIKSQIDRSLTWCNMTFRALSRVTCTG